MKSQLPNILACDNQDKMRITTEGSIDYYDEGMGLPSF